MVLKSEDDGDGSKVPRNASFRRTRRRCKLVFACRRAAPRVATTDFTASDSVVHADVMTDVVFLSSLAVVAAPDATGDATDASPFCCCRAPFSRLDVPSSFSSSSSSSSFSRRRGRRDVGVVLARRAGISGPRPESIRCVSTDARGPTNRCPTSALFL